MEKEFGSLFNDLRQMNFDEAIRRLNHFIKAAQDRSATEAQKEFALACVRSLVQALGARNNRALLYFEEDNDYRTNP